MKEYLPVLKIICVLIILILLKQLTGCYSFKIISSYDLPYPRKFPYDYTIFSQNLKKFALENIIISNGILSGKIVDSKHSYHKNSIQVYLSSDSVIKIDTLKNILSIPLDSIAQVKKPKFSIFKTISFLAGCYIGIYALAIIALWLGGGINPIPI